jgi:hypothetical protein
MAIRTIQTLQSIKSVETCRDVANRSRPFPTCSLDDRNATYIDFSVETDCPLLARRVSWRTETAVQTHFASSTQRSRVAF